MPDYTLADWIASIRAAPDCDVTRLAFADWLEETGTDVGWARFIRSGIADAGRVPLVFNVRSYTGPRETERHTSRVSPSFSWREHEIKYRWEPAWSLGVMAGRGMAGFVLKHLPPPGDKTPPNRGFVRKAVFRRGLLEHLSVPNDWWLEHGDAVCARTGPLTVVTPHEFDCQFDGGVPFLYDTDPTHGIYQTRRRCRDTAFILLDDGARIATAPVLREEYPSVTFRVSPDGR